MYYIVKCENCGTFRYIKGGVKSFTCMKCGKTTKVERATIFTSVASLEDAREIVVKLNTRRYAQKIDSYNGEFSTAIPSSLPKEGKMRAIKRCIYKLGERGLFTAEDLRNALLEDGFDMPLEKVEDIINQLLLQGYLYEPEPQKYSLV